ncbi:MAG: HU family DNA-binding protein [Candidatus Micrarchaeia archaeon]|jgi:DNA-binding protein HU-beta
MTKAELVKGMAKEAGITQKDAEAALDGLVRCVGAALIDGEDATIPGLGTFKVKATAARQGRNPATGAAIDIPAGKKVSFKCHKNLREAIA